MNKIVEYVVDIENAINASSTSIEDIWGMIGKLNKLIDYKTRSSTLVNNLILASLNREVNLPEIIDMLGIVKKEFANDDIDLSTANYDALSDMIDDNPNMLSGLTSKEGNVEHFRNILNDVNTRFINFGDKDIIGMVHLPSKTIHPFSLSRQMLLNNMDFADVTDFDILDPNIAREAITESIVSGDVATVSDSLKLDENAMNKIIDDHWGEEYYAGELAQAWNHYVAQTDFKNKDPNKVTKYEQDLIKAFGTLVCYWVEFEQIAYEDEEAIEDCIKYLKEFNKSEVIEDLEVYNEIVSVNNKFSGNIRDVISKTYGPIKWVKINNISQFYQAAVKGDYKKISPIITAIAK